MPDQLCHFREQDPPPTVRGEEGLLLLQHAWNEYDVAKYHGNWYVFISQALTLSYLVLGVSIVILVVILTVFCGDVVVAGTNSSSNSGDVGASSSSDTGGNCVLQGLSEKVMERTIFFLTLAVTLIVSLDQCIKPARRAMHLKPAAEKLKSWIWLYRQPAGTRRPHAPASTPCGLLDVGSWFGAAHILFRSTQQRVRCDCGGRQGTAMTLRYHIRLCT